MDVRELDDQNCEAQYNSWCMNWKWLDEEEAGMKPSLNNVNVYGFEALSIFFPSNR